MNNFSMSRLGHNSIVFIMYLSLFHTNIKASAVLKYEVERFSPRAHQLMKDHGENAVYNVFIDQVEAYLPNELRIRNKTIRWIDKHVKPARHIIKKTRCHLLTSDQVARQTDPFSFFNAFREHVPYTYVILNDRLIFTESTDKPNKEIYKDKMSKHYLISGLKSNVHFAGEMRIFKHSKKGELFIVFDNASGTYRPPTNLLPGVRELMSANFKKSKRIHFITKSFEQNIDEAKLFAHEEEPIKNL